MDGRTRLGEIGERGVIKEIRSLYEYSFDDDDCAAIEFGDMLMLLTTDSINRLSHIPDGVTPAEIGRFFAAINLSDIAAMGGRPLYFMTAIELERDTRISWVREFEAGIKDMLDRYGVRLLGGDTKEGTTLSLAGFAVGEVGKDKVLRRRNCREGDVIYVTGTVGKNAAAYYMWRESKSRRWASRMLDVKPRINEGMALSEMGATSAIDLSDGLFASVRQLSEASGIGILLDYNKLPIDMEAVHASESCGVDLMRIACEVGGEYELLLGVPKARAAKFEEEAALRGIALTRIGVARGKGCAIETGGGVEEIVSNGYEHFSDIG